MKYYLAVCLFCGVLFWSCYNTHQVFASDGNPYPHTYVEYDEDGNEIYHPGNCTWQAWEECYNRLGIKLPGWGNGGTWHTSAENAGYKVIEWSEGTEIPDNCLIEWKNHVAWVVYADDNGIYLAEGNLLSNGEYQERVEKKWSWNDLRNRWDDSGVYITIVAREEEPDAEETDAAIEITEEEKTEEVIEAEEPKEMQTEADEDSEESGDEKISKEEPEASVDEEPFFEESLQWAEEKQLTYRSGLEELSAEKGCTRAQFISLLYKEMGNPETRLTENIFEDVHEKDSFYKAVLWAYENGITTETLFRPDEFMSRGHAVTFLYRAAGSPSVNAENPFTDVSEDAYYKDAVIWAYENGITKGTFNKNLFKPEAICTQGQCLTFLMRMFR